MDIFGSFFILHGGSPKKFLALLLILEVFLVFFDSFTDQRPLAQLPIIEVNCHDYELLCAKKSESNYQNDSVEPIVKGSKAQIEENETSDVIDNGLIEELVSDELPGCPVGPLILPESILLAAEEEAHEYYEHNSLEHHLDTIDFLEVELLINKVRHIVVWLNIESFCNVLAKEILLIEVAKQFKPKFEVKRKLVREQNEDIKCVDDLELGNE